jgi:hypothetical protein
MGRGWARAHLHRVLCAYSQSNRRITDEHVILLFGRLENVFMQCGCHPSGRVSHAAGMQKTLTGHTCRRHVSEVAWRPDVIVCHWHAATNFAQRHVRFARPVCAESFVAALQHIQLAQTPAAIRCMQYQSLSPSIAWTHSRLSIDASKHHKWDTLDSD